MDSWSVCFHSNQANSAISSSSEPIPKVCLRCRPPVFKNRKINQTNMKSNTSTMDHPKSESQSCYLVSQVVVWMVDLKEMFNKLTD